VGRRLALGQGLIGQCAIEKQKVLLTHIPPDYISISSGLGNAKPQNIIVLPVVFEGNVKAVLELASFDRFSPTHEAFLDQLTESIGIVLNTIEANMRTEDLLAQSQSMAKELQSRQEELENTNVELQSNARLLALQNEEVERKNREVEQARQALEEKAGQLALTSKYKSEFMANMSHELRTPLNSLLILSDQLSKNPDGNLTSKQMEYCKTIHSSGNDLLMLINDILDLSKIESGTVIVDPGELRFSDLHSYVERTFRHMAESKDVDFTILLDPGLPEAILTDSKRLQQIIKNLLANAFKFTHRGRVALTIHRAASGWDAGNQLLNDAEAVIAFTVSDTGIGIAPDKQRVIFEAFQQADGSTNRKYGGTGLGLNISREIARLLGGEINLKSALGQGSTFTLYVPQTYMPSKTPRKAPPDVIDPAPDLLASRTDPVLLDVDPLDLPNEASDDRNDIQPGDRVLLIVDNDIQFARVVLETAREHGFKGLVMPLGSGALAIARNERVDAITLDIRLPDIDGWRFLDYLKCELETRHIPVVIISTIDHPEQGLSRGAIGVLAKPIDSQQRLAGTIGDLARLVNRRERQVLLVEEDPDHRDYIQEFLAGDGLQLTAARTSEEALQLAAQREWDCIVIGQNGDGHGCSLTEKIVKLPEAAGRPLIAYSPGEKHLSAAPVLQNSQIILAQAPEQLLDRIAFVLHRPVGQLSQAQQEAIQSLHRANGRLAGRKVLIVDDDIRNIFALTSVLEREDICVLSAETGRDAIEILQNDPDIDIVLMDIMMPEMDGLGTTRAIRQLPQFKSLPIIAVTAKAMKGDREKCLEAGAWDYVAKPVHPDHLLSVLRSWLSA
jgi:signal transduction histidine kinase/DNA-binding response OmpR family regulator